MAATARGRILIAIAAALAVAGATLIAFTLTSQHHAPVPNRLAQTAPVGPQPTQTPALAAPNPKQAPRSAAPTRALKARKSLPPVTTDLAMPPARPVDLTIPALGVHSSLLTLGINADASVQVPPLSEVARAGWYQFSAEPGMTGSAVLLGHVDSAQYGAGVFFNLGALRPGDEADVIRADGSTAVFRIDRVSEFPKSNFPTDLVYGRSSYASIRLVTCGGRFDSATGNYVDNIVAFGTLAAAR